jgi:hypothetical protein
MKRLSHLFFLGLLISCTTEYNNYYYGKENLRWFICGWDHYIVIEDLGDSLQIWNLGDECNYGYGWTDSRKIPKTTGEFAKIEITKITERKIELGLDRGHEVVDFKLSRQTSNEKVFRIINIVQMLRTDKDMEDYIHEKSDKAKPNTNYLFQNYKANEKVEELSPEEFSAYYREKKLLEAQRIVKELEVN